MIEYHTVNPEAYDIPTEGDPWSRWKQTRKALQDHLEMAGKNVAYIRAPQGELRRIADNFPDGLMRFQVHYNPRG